MKFLDNIKMGPKLILAFLITAAIAVVIGFFSVAKLVTLDEADTVLFEKGAVPLGDWGDIRQATYRIRANLRDIYITGEFEAYAKRIAARVADREKAEATFEKSLVSDDAKALWKTYKENQAKIGEINKRILELLKNGRKAEAQTLQYGESETLQQEQNKIYDEMQDQKVKFAKTLSDSNTKTAKAAEQAVYVLMAIGALLAAGLGIIISRSIAQPLQKGVEMMNEMGKGHLSTRLKMDRKDEIGILARAMDGFTDNLQGIVGGLQEISKGDLSRDWVAADGQDEINPALKQVRANLQALVADANVLSKAAVDGKLATRADASQHQGDYKKIVQGVNDCLDAVIGPLNVAAGYVDRISKGDIPPKITATYNGDFNTLKHNLNQCADAVNSLVADAAALSKAAVDGKLATRADASKHQGDFRKIVQGVNDCLDAVIGPLNVAAGYVDRISKGDIPPKITDNYNGDFNTIKSNLNTCVEAVNGLVADANILSKAAMEGKLATRANASKHQGDFRKIVQGVNDTLDAVVGPLNVAAGYVDRISKGDIPPKITDNYSGDFNTIKSNLNTCVDAVNGLVADAGVLAKAAAEGKLATRADATKHQGDFRKIVQGVNDTLDGVIGPINEVQRVMGAIEQGDLTARIHADYKGDLQTLRNAVNNSAAKLAQSLTEISSAANSLASSSDELTSTSSTMATTAEAMTKQANTAAAGTEQASANVKSMAAGVEQISANSNTVASASEEVNANLRTVGAAVEEMSANMRTIAGGTEQMTTSVNTVAAAIEEMSVSLKEVSRNSGQAATVAGKAAQAAGTTAQTVDKLGKSAQEIGKVVDMIKGIAAQTNLLALNATIEAASAGEAGKGFAVVANEVKELAKQTAGATEEIRAQVEGMQANTQQAVKAIDEIVQIINEINSISGMIAAAVEEQTATTNEISKSVGSAAQGANDVSKNVQQAAAGANEVSKNVQEAVKGVSDITRNINQLASGATDVAKNAAEAAKGMNDVARNVGTVSTAARDTTQGATDTNAAAKELARLAERLQGNVAKFKL